VTGDFTRFSHQPRRGYAGVLMQQGRVTLDADWNEQVEIQDQRWRLQTIDTIGRACAPAGDAGFALSLTPDRSDLVIGPGRLYLDGLLVENPEPTPVAAEPVDDATVSVASLAPDDEPFAPGGWVEVVSRDPKTGQTARTVARIDRVDAEAPRLRLDADLGGHAGHEAMLVRRLVTYLTQPFFPAAAEPPFGDRFEPRRWGGQTHIAYLDVWRRHVTAVEDPHLREVALGGPDTATRVQTAWSLRILRDLQGEPVDTGQIGCQDDHPAWSALTAPSGGRMSARAEAAPDPEDPCAIAPEAGYRGLENRLYRVEVHTPGELGTATFKWSRDNGSILSAVVAFEADDRLRVHSLGKDQVLRFDADDRVEVLSDQSELSGRPGTMASIVGAPDQAERAFTIDQDVSVYAGHDTPRARRWDHGGEEPATADDWLDLEAGVQVRFGAGPFRTGDYWVVPARVATGDVEGFVDAPPRGVEHHYARLALITWPTANTPAEILDCRATFPPLCGLETAADRCCAVSVGDGGDHASLREAVDAVADVEGPVRICLLPGEHRLPVTVVVRRGNLTISGCGQQSRVVSALGGALLLLGVENVRLEDLWIFSSSRLPTVAALDAVRLEIVDCLIANLYAGERPEPQPPGDLPPPPPPDGPFDPPGGPFDPPRGPFEPRGAPPPGTVGGDPLLLRPAGPAVVTGRSAGVLVDRCLLVGAPAVSLAAATARVEHNVIRGGGVWVREGSSRVEVRSNSIVGGVGAGVLLGGLLDGEQPQGPVDGVSHVTVAGNRIEAMAREGVSTPYDPQRLAGETEDVVVSGNTIRGCGWVPLTEGVAVGGGILLWDATRARVLDNIVADNGPTEAAAAAVKLGFGVIALSCQGVEVRGNRIADNGVLGTLDDDRIVTNAGIAVLGATGTAATGLASLVLRDPAALVRENTVVTPEGPGVMLHGVGPMSVNDNSVTSSYLGRNRPRFGRAVLVVNLGAAPDLGLVPRAGGGQGIARQLHGPVQIGDNQISVQADARGLPEFDPGEPPRGTPASQLIDGSAVLAVTFDDLLFQGNQVVNEVLPLLSGFLRLQSSVATFGATTRAIGNRMTEFPATALLSYVGFSLAHLAVDNMSTHCLRVDGATATEHHNYGVLCPPPELETRPRFQVIVGR
jgi:Family of unknown function (DUF6519)/Right handed beta helix region